MFSKWFQPNKIYRLHYTFYTWTGFYKIDSKSTWKKLFYNIYHILMELCYIFTTLALMVGAYTVRNNVGKLSSNLCVTICLFGQMNKIWFLQHKHKESEKIRDKFDNNLNVPHVGKCVADQKIFEKHSKESGMSTLLLYGLSIPLLIFWIAFPLIDSGEERRFPVQWPPIPGMKISPGYEVMYIYISLELVQFCTNIMSYDLIFYGYLIRISAHFEILAKNIRKINDLYPKINFEGIIHGYRGNDREMDFIEHNYKFESIIRGSIAYGEESSRKKEVNLMNSKNIEKWRYEETMKMIKMNIDHHTAILQTLKEIGKLYQGPIIFHVSCGAAMIGVLAYGIIAESESFNSEVLQRFLFVSGTMFDLYIYCHYGTQITELSYKLANVLYDIPWYEMEKAPRRLIAFAMAKFQKPPEISGAKIFPINLLNYLKLLRIAYDMIALLRQTRHHSQED